MIRTRGKKVPRKITKPEFYERFKFKSQKNRNKTISVLTKLQ